MKKNLSHKKLSAPINKVLEPVLVQSKRSKSVFNIRRADIATPINIDLTPVLEKKPEKRIGSPKPFIGTSDPKPRRTQGFTSSSKKQKSGSKSPEKIESEVKKLKKNFTVKSLKIKGLIKSKVVTKLTDKEKEREFHQT